MDNFTPTVLMVIPISGYAEGVPQYAIFVKREVENLSSGGVKVVTLFLRSRFKISVLRSFRKEVKKAIVRYEADILHIQTGTAGLFLLGSSIDIPTIVTIGGSDLLGYPGTSFFWQLRGKLASTVTRLVSQRANQVLVVSDNLAQALPNTLKRPAQVIPRAVNTNFFKPMGFDEARGALQWDKRKYYVVFSDPRPDMMVKNKPLALEVLRMVNAALGDRVELIIIYKKTPEQVLLMLNAADALLVTSLHEGSPNIVKEAMACNLPVVSVPCGDVKKRLSDVINSYVVSYDANQISKYLTMILEKQHRSNGREILYQQGLSSEAFVKSIKTIYSEIIT